MTQGIAKTDVFYDAKSVMNGISVILHFLVQFLESC